MKASAQTLEIRRPSGECGATVLAFPAPRERFVYGRNQRANLPALGFSMGIALLAFSALSAGHAVQQKHHSPKLDVLEIKAPPPPPSPPTHQPAPQPVAKAQPIILPETPLPPPADAPRITAIATDQTPPPPAMMADASPAAPVAAAAPITAAALAVENGGDLSSSMISATPPRYPLESRRKREQGLVLLRVLLAIDGRVAEISVAQSSGHDRLDQAALAAPRRWRWSPARRNGALVQLRGLVEIPFVLQEK